MDLAESLNIWSSAFRPNRFTYAFSHLSRWRNLVAQSDGQLISSDDMAKKRTGFSKWLVYVLVRGFMSIWRLFPVVTVFKLGEYLGVCACKLLPKRRQIVAHNLAVVEAWFKEQGRELEIGEDPVRELFKRAGANLLSGFCFSHMSVEELGQHVEFENEQLFFDALAESQGKGVIMLLSHMGPWEILSAMTLFMPEEHGEPKFGSLYRPLDNVYLDDWVHAQRALKGTRLFSRKDGFHAPAEFLKDGGVLGILADQRAGKGDAVPFFGEATKTTPLPGLMHRRTGAQMLALSIKTVKPGLWRIRLHPVDLKNISEADHRDRTAFSLVCNQAIEQSLSESILDGFWLHDRFRAFKKHFRPRAQKRETDTADIEN